MLADDTRFLFPEAIVDGRKNMVGDHKTKGIGVEIFKYFVRFVSTSPHARALEQLKVVTDQVKCVISGPPVRVLNNYRSTHKEPVFTHNAETNRPRSFRLHVPDEPADNPQQAEEASHIGHHGLYFCRRCFVHPLLR